MSRKGRKREGPTKEALREQGNIFDASSGFERLESGPERIG